MNRQWLDLALVSHYTCSYYHDHYHGRYGGRLIFSRAFLLLYCIDK